MSAAPILTILKNGETVKSCEIEGEAMLGRAEGCVIRLDDRAISRQHVVFKVVDGGVQVEKKSEFAPLVINGAEATRAILREADVISIGPYLMRISVPKAVAPAPVMPPPLAGQTQPIMQDNGSMEPLVPESGGAFGDVADLGALPGAGAEGGEKPAAGAEGIDAPALSLDGSAPPADEMKPDEVAIDPAASDQGLGMGLSPPPDEPIEQADDDAKTKLTPAAKLNVRLVFAPGAANVTDFELTKDEVSIGRGKNCDIILNDKKSSRKNAIIRRAGLNFTIKDLDSANGTFVNGVRIREQELASDDVVKIGAVEFQFKALSADYAAREQGFMPVPEDPLPGQDASADQALGDPNALMAAAPGGGMDFQGLVPAGAPDPGLAALQGGVPGADPNAGGVAGIAGITGIGPGDVKQMKFLDKVRNFQTLPKKEKIKIGLILAGLAFVFYEVMLDDDQVTVQKKPKPKAGVVAATGVVKGPATFETLSPEQQRFVEAQHGLAFDYYKNKEYDKSIFELNKIFALINDYKDSRDIERYAREGKRKLEAFEEEKRKKEEEAQLKAKVAALVEECTDRMKKKQYDQAQELFTQISLLDPDNQLVTGWKKEIEQFLEDKRAAEQTKQVQLEINKRAWEVYSEALAIKKQGKYHTAIDAFAKVADIGASDPKPVALAQKAIHACFAAIKAMRDPVLAEAKASEDALDYPKAFALYKKATKIDPPHPAGYAGMARIRGILHDRAKLVYTEAILAESVSDFTVARKKFKECLEIAPVDDIYHDRAERKLSRYFKREEGQQ